MRDLKSPGMSGSEVRSIQQSLQVNENAIVSGHHRKPLSTLELQPGQDHNLQSNVHAGTTSLTFSKPQTAALLAGASAAGKPAAAPSQLNQHQMNAAVKGSLQVNSASRRK